MCVKWGSISNPPYDFKLKESEEVEELIID